MLCERARELLSEYCEGSLPAALTVPFESHLKVCDVCRLELEGLRSVWSDLSHLPTVEAPSDFRARVWQRIEETQAATPTKRRRTLSWRPDLRWLMSPRGVRWVGAAAALAVIALLIVPIAVTPARLVFPWNVLATGRAGWSVKPEAARIEVRGDRYNLVVPLRAVSKSDVPVVIVPDVNDRRDVLGETSVSLSPSSATEVRLEVGAGALGRRVLLRISRAGDPGDFRVVPVSVPEVLPERPR